MSQYFPKPYEPFGGDINVQVDLSNYITKANIKNISHTDTSSFPLKSNLASLIKKTDVDKLDTDKLKSLPNNLSNLKSKVDKLDINKLAPVLVDLSKLTTNVVKNEVVKKIEYNANIKNIEYKIPNIVNLATKTILNTKINEVKIKIPSINGLATTSALTVVENKIPNVCNLVKTMTQKLMKLKRKLLIIIMANISLLQNLIRTAEHFAARLAQANLLTKTDVDNKLSSFNRKITSNKTKYLLVENHLKKLETFDSIYFRGKSNFEDDGTQNYLVFQTVSRYFKTAKDNDSNILSWKSKGLSDESLLLHLRKFLTLH